MSILPTKMGKLAIAAVIVIVAAAAGLLVWQPWNSGAVSVRFKTERGEGATQGTVNSPLHVIVQVPGSDGSPETALAGVSLRFLDEQGNPATFGDGKEEAFYMKPSTTIGIWEYTGSVPTVPGTYHVKVELARLYGETGNQAIELTSPKLEALAEKAAPLSSGFVFPSEGNLWTLSTDASRQRRLTYFPPADEYADKPAWSPDGKTIAFTYLPKVQGSELPSTEIWGMDPDGQNKRQLVAHGKNESLTDASWSPDGKYIYFGVDTIVTDPSGGAPIGQNRRIDRVDLSSGQRNAVFQGAQSPRVGPGGEIVYLEDTVPQDLGGSPGQRMLLVSADDTRETELVNDATYQRMLAPHVSPDGRWVVFSAVNVPPAQRGSGSGSGSGFDFFKWLLWVPEVASAHGQPWDLFIVPAAGGPSTRLTTLDEDEPYPTWIDSKTLAFMGATGLYKLSIYPDGKPNGTPTKIDEGSRHGGLTWHAP